MNGEIRVAELFAGIGGFRLGLEQANEYSDEKTIEQFKNTRPMCRGVGNTARGGINGKAFSVVWANEWNRYACQIYRKNFGEKELVEGDITQINTDTIPDIDMLVGGFPCQPFSLAGKRQGFKDIRGTLFNEIIRIAAAKQPDILLLENVKGLLSHDGGDTFETILRALGNAGYWWEYKVLNSKFFGVPQNRERVFIIGHSRKFNSKQIFPIGEVGGGVDESCGEDEGKGQRVQLANTLSSRYYKDGSENLITTAILADNLGGNIKQRERDASCNPAWTLGGSKKVIQIGELNKGSQAGRIYSPDGLAPTLHKSGGCTEPLIAQALQTDGYLRSGSSFGTDKPQSNCNIRRLTPIECERLQGFPDGWTEGVSDTQRYKCLGNAVTVPVIQAIGELLLEVID